MGRLLYHGENLNSVPNDANLVKMNDGTNVEDSIESVKNAFTDIVSDAYSSTKTYSVDDLCIYNNKLWKCKVGCTGQTPTENTYWTQTTIAESAKDNSWTSALGTKSNYLVTWIYDRNVTKSYGFIPIDKSIIDNCDITVVGISLQGVANYTSGLTVSTLNNGILVIVSTLASGNYAGCLGYSTLNITRKS